VSGLPAAKVCTTQSTKASLPTPTEPAIDTATASSGTTDSTVK
jgi:hypothetical protein